MTTLAPEDKSTLVMVYTENSLIRGELITKQAVRVSTWLRTQGVPDYIHIFKPTVVYFGTAVKVHEFKELFVPVDQVLAFHLTPSVEEPMDYEENEANRAMVQVIALPGAFIFKGVMRISASAELATSIELAHSDWMSLYEVDVSSPVMPQMQTLHLPIILIRSKRVNLAVG
jgi:hypothetical protein